MRDLVLAILLVFAVGNLFGSTPNATRAGIAERDDFPHPSRVQEHRVIPRRHVTPLADRGACLVDHACYCDGPIGQGGECHYSQTCKPLVNNYCAYWCDDPMHCSSISGQECENFSCSGH